MALILPRDSTTHTAHRCLFRLATCATSLHSGLAAVAGWEIVLADSLLDMMRKIRAPRTALKACLQSLLELWTLGPGAETVVVRLLRPRLMRGKTLVQRLAGRSATMTWILLLRVMWSCSIDVSGLSSFFLSVLIIAFLYIGLLPHLLFENKMEQSFLHVTKYYLSYSASNNGFTIHDKTQYY